MKDVDALMVARFMYDRNAEQLDADEAARDFYWGDEGVRLFWTGEAEAVLEFIGFASPDVIN